MTRVRLENFTISLDGYGAGPDQTIDNPLGIGGEALHDWLISTHSWRQMHGMEGGASGIDDDFAARGLDNFGAWIIGRNMFGPVRGPWTEMTWRGWWGDEPPFACPVFVLTHHPRPPIEMKNGTIFHFITEGIHQALALARQAARGKNVRIGGGVNTIRQYLGEGLIDELHIAIAPVLLGRGEALFRDLDLPALGYQCADRTGSKAATHVILKRKEECNA